MGVNPDPGGPKINAARLLKRQKMMAQIGATGRGGVNRQALSAADTEARKLLLSWTAARKYAAEMDPIGNLFIRRPGSDPTLSAVMTGSHLDSQPTGGNFDGVYGVLAGLEAIETLDDSCIETKRPTELVVWMNEEGCRFPPATMGSAVSAGALDLHKALETKDDVGITVREALFEQRSSLTNVGHRKLGTKGFAFIEAHIEQGPILEASGSQVGVVTGIQGMCSYEVQVIGFEAHAGTTPRQNRQDALTCALGLITKLRQRFEDPADILRFTVGKFDVYPGAPNTVPGRVNFTIDLRHPTMKELQMASQAVFETCSGTLSGCSITTRQLLQTNPVIFDPQVVDLIRSATVQRHIRHQELVSGATHDSVYMASLTPTAMIFVPCEKGISHNERENAADEDLIAGGQVLCDTLVSLLTAKI